MSCPGYQRTMNIHMATLESAVKDCLDADKSDASYIWQYSHALNGRHYRFLWQCLPLQLLGIFPKAEDKVTCQVMLAIAALGAHLWFPVIKNVENTQYVIKQSSGFNGTRFTMQHELRSGDIDCKCAGSSR